MFLHDELWNSMSLNEMKQREEMGAGEMHTLILAVPIALIKSFIDTAKQ